MYTERALSGARCRMSALCLARTWTNRLGVLAMGLAPLVCRG